jgi:GNAT superfamily N-acetyltransferase
MVSVNPTIGWHDGSRSEIRGLFELAEDSQFQLDQYFDLGRVLVARTGSMLVGHLQLVPTDRSEVTELKSMAVIPESEGQGVGRALIEAAADHCRIEGASLLLVSTATASVGNLRFYQRCGFRFLFIDRDAFTPETGYPDPIQIDGVTLRDRIWLCRDLTGADP